MFKTPLFGFPKPSMDDLLFITTWLTGVCCGIAICKLLVTFA